MKIYDTLVVGAGYFAVGYATKNGNTILCEERQALDTAFCLPFRGFTYLPYTPKTAEGERLKACFDEFSLFLPPRQNANGFEFALCSYVREKGLDVLLKCRVVAYALREDGIYDVTVQTNEGLSHLYAKKVLKTTGELQRPKLSVLFMTKEIEKAKREMLSVFEGAEIEPAFYENRYVLYAPVDGLDENGAKVAVYTKWKTLSCDAKILCIAPVFFGAVDNSASDMAYQNPIEAFESGYFYAEKESGV